MAYERRDGDFILFPNKSDNEQAPQMTGSLLWDGVEIRLSAWKKEGTKGVFLAGRAEVKHDKIPPKNNPINNDLPF